MRRVIILSLIFLITPLLVMAKKNNEADELLNYQIEATGATGAQGTYLVKTYVVSKDKKVSDDVIGKCAVHGVLFKGFSSAETRQHQKPLAGSPAVEQQNADFFNAFFADGGAYRNYIQVIGNSRTVVKAGKEYKVGADVTVFKEQLRKDLEQQGIIKGLNTGF